jgi:hypothetical protein
MSLNGTSHAITSQNIYPLTSQITIIPQSRTRDRVTRILTPSAPTAGANRQACLLRRSGSIFRHRTLPLAWSGTDPSFLFAPIPPSSCYHPTGLRREVRTCAKVLDAIGDALGFLGCGMSIRKGVNEQGRDMKRG